MSERVDLWQPVDRERLRRDVEEYLNDPGEPASDLADEFARRCLDLLAELELAEQEIAQLGEFYAAAQARLAKLDVEALREIVAVAHEALAAWEKPSAENPAYGPGNPDWEHDFDREGAS